MRYYLLYLWKLVFLKLLPRKLLKSSNFNVWTFLSDFYWTAEIMLPPKKFEVWSNTSKSSRIYGVGWSRGEGESNFKPPPPPTPQPPTYFHTRWKRPSVVRLMFLKGILVLQNIIFSVFFHIQSRLAKSTGCYKLLTNFLEKNASCIASAIFMFLPIKMI